MMNFYNYYKYAILDKNNDYRNSLDIFIDWWYKSDNLPPRRVIEKISHIIKKNPEYAVWYASHTISGRWVAAEPYIMKNPYYAYSYAWGVMECRWVEAEPFIMKNDHWWGFYKRRFNI